MLDTPMHDNLPALQQQKPGRKRRHAKHKVAVEQMLPYLNLFRDDNAAIEALPERLPKSTLTNFYYSGLADEHWVHLAYARHAELVALGRQPCRDAQQEAKDRRIWLANPDASRAAEAEAGGYKRTFAAQTRPRILAPRAAPSAALALQQAPDGATFVCLMTCPDTPQVRKMLAAFAEAMGCSYETDS